MRYISGIQALNMHYTNQTTPGDWHGLSVDFSNPQWYYTEQSPFLDFDIELRKFPGIKEKVYVANHTRACLDLIYECKYSVIAGMKNTLIDDKLLNELLLQKLLLLIKDNNFQVIFNLILKEYRLDWINVLEKNGVIWQNLILNK
ncbi:MAG: hypothetical protein LBV51_04880, partial [Acholeplasmatales bacterium]|nr:hypothetical protein [Acholeplasmatales bacterium]